MQSLAGQAAGRLAEFHGAANRHQDALGWSRRAIWHSQQSHAAALTYRFEWQSARSLMKLGQADEAIEAYRRAIQTMRGVRHDLFLGFSNLGSDLSFRQVVGPLLYEYMDLLLQRARKQADTAMSTTDLLAAREALELFRSAEIEDYFRDECASALNKKRVDISEVGKRTGVLYLFPLADRTEILVTLPGGLKQFVTSVDSKTLNATVRSLRRKLEDRTTYEYLEEAAQLYKWLIEPVRDTLKAEDVQTLVFVPDGDLRTIPMSVLYDEVNEKYLIEQFAVANSPGLSLMDTRALAAQPSGVLINALSDEVQGFAPLPFVVSEVEKLQGLYTADTLINQNFTLDQLQNAFSERSYNIVHVASHGHFGSAADDTYLLTYDGRIPLDALEALLQPTQFRQQPIELLTLSACQTAAGDDRSALGLAGLAIKAGARSTMATLWSVNDQASSQLVANFYQELSQPTSAGKADALRRAQRSLLTDLRYQHPYYWSPFLIIGNWL
jgi:CHAT domain-containing protein